MGMVTLVSGGLDSTLMSYMALEEGVEQFPLFVDYGQRARDKEFAACAEAMRRIGLPPPKVADLPGFGKLVPSGLTNEKLHILDDAFTPGRNMLFLLLGAAYAVTVKADTVAIGLLHEDSSLFPDQTALFLVEAERMLSLCLGQKVSVIAPLASFHKVDVVALAKLKGISGTYSCHSGAEEPCGDCIACNEFKFKEV